MKATKNLTEGNIYRNFLLYAIPMILSSLLSLAYSTIDAVIAGKFINENALGAISAAGSLDTTLLSLVGGVSAGFAIYVSQLFGKGDFASLKRDVFSIAVTLAGVAALISTAIVVFRHPILHYLKVDPVLYRDTEIYFSIYSAGYVIIFLNSLLSSTLHALGVTAFSLYLSPISAVLNIVGNLLSVAVLGWGVAGIAISTLVSALVCSVAYLLILKKAFRELEVTPSALRFTPSSLRDSARYTIPTALQQASFHGVTLLIAPAINALGASATTGYNVANRIYALCTPCLWAATSAFACYTAQCVGEGNCQKIRRGVRVGFLMNALMLLPFVLVFSVFARPIVAIFFPTGFEGDAYQYAVRYATIFLPFVYIQLVEHIIHSYLRSLGRVSVVLGITLFGSVVRVAATLLLVPSMLLDGAFLGQILSWVADTAVSLFLFLAFYRTEKQLSRVIASLPVRKKAAADR